MQCCPGSAAEPSNEAAWRSNAWRVISPVLASYCAWMMTVTFFARSSATRV